MIFRIILLCFQEEIRETKKSGGFLVVNFVVGRFGQGYYNGFGGKVETGETVEEAAAREVRWF
jgi:8-oxo-dGTP pyrophosphatase MutT (NUDIX family)